MLKIQRHRNSMGMVKLRPFTETKPRTDYDKTLHNWLRPRDEHVNQNLCQSAVRERLAKYMKYKASSFLLFSRTHLLKSFVDGFRRAIAQNTRCDVKSAFLGSTQWPTTFWGSNFPKTVKMAFWRLSLARRIGETAYTINSILGITAAVYFPVIKHYIQYGNSVLTSEYTICTQSVVQGVA